MNKPHKHAEYIKAFADGEQVEYQNIYSDGHNSAAYESPGEAAAVAAITCFNEKVRATTIKITYLEGEKPKVDVL